MLTMLLAISAAQTIGVRFVTAQDQAGPRVSGLVVDNNRHPVSKVKISLKGRVVGESGDDGAFSVVLTRSEPRIALTFAADGYVSNTRVFDSKATGINTVVIWPVAYRVKFDASRSLDIELGSSRIKISANVLTGADGVRLTDLAVLEFTLFDVTNPFHRAAAPGDFSGQLPDRSIRRLNSYGIFAFDLKDQKGRRLSFSRGAKIDLSIAVPPKLVRSAPKEIGFFNFDTVMGRWVQVGSFVFVPNTLTYNGSITSFGGSHNLDEPQDTTCITVQVVNMYDGSPMPNFNVTAQGQQYTFTGTTDSSGFVCLLVQRNATFTVSSMGVLSGNTWGTPNPPTFTSPNFSSGAADCGNSCTTCPFLGTVPLDFLVGTGPLQLQRFMHEK